MRRSCGGGFGLVLGQANRLSYPWNAGLDRSTITLATLAVGIADKTQQWTASIYPASRASHDRLWRQHNRYFHQ